MAWAALRSLLLFGIPGHLAPCWLSLRIARFACLSLPALPGIACTSWCPASQVIAGHCRPFDVLLQDLSLHRRALRACFFHLALSGVLGILHRWIRFYYHFLFLHIFSLQVIAGHCRPPRYHLFFRMIFQHLALPGVGIAVFFAFCLVVSSRLIHTCKFFNAARGLSASRRGIRSQFAGLALELYPEMEISNVIDHYLIASKLFASVSVTRAHRRSVFHSCALQRPLGFLGRPMADVA